jgi:uncharacterized membrane protein YhaH (DUF805 family)
LEEQMTNTMTVQAQPTVSTGLRRRGRWCLVAALVGIAQGAAVLAWPHQVSDARFSFPFTASWFVVAQATFFLQHLPLAVAVGALTAVPAIRREKWACRGIVVASAGIFLLALLELIAMSAANTANDSTLGTTIDSLYGVPVGLAGGGLLVAGIVLLRRKVLDRGLSWTLAAIGGFVFVGLTPALSTDSFVGGRVAIMGWMVLFALLGWMLQRSER